MPPLIPNGPDLPIELLESHAAGNLVLFVGAGISCPTFPLFKGLVEQVYAALAEERSGEEERAFKKGEYDRVLGLLEGRVDLEMRRKVLARLRKVTPDAADRHRALLEIAEFGGEVRIVTTNFDRLFLEAGLDRTRVSVAPELVVPRKPHWKGLVHLHGLIEDNDPEGRNLVLTSADFGRAYLLDRWAGRFVSELFHNFDVLFVGYGVNDPVMRYLLDALAAERNRGGNFRQAFALVGLKGRRAERVALRQEWESKGLVPIFYEAARGHGRLNRTLKAWAELTRGGLRTRQSWALRHADKPPPNTAEDDARLVVWALSEPKGAVARAFSQHVPVPLIGWLRIFEQSDEVFPKLLEVSEAEPQPGQVGQRRRSSLPLVDSGSRTAGPPHLSRVTRHLMNWLVKHLDKAPLLEWVLEKGGVLHPEFRQQVRRRLVDGDENLIPDPYRQVWQILASDSYTDRQVASQFSGPWRATVQLGSGPAVVRRDLLRLITPVPRLTLRRTDDLDALLGKPAGVDPASIQDLVNIDVELGGRFGELSVQRLMAEGQERVLRQLARDVPWLLEDAVEWLALGGRADEEADSSHLAVPSLSPHDQNRYAVRSSHDWSWLIDLNRRTLELLDREDPAAARRLVGQWSAADRFPIFRRLILHAATEAQAVGPAPGVALLLDQCRGSLWRSGEMREVLRFLRIAASRLTEAETESLCAAILEGPPQSFYPDQLANQRFSAIADWRKCQRLVRLRQGGAKLTTEAAEFLRWMDESSPCPPSDDELDEFPFTHHPFEVPGGELDEWRERVKRFPGRCLSEMRRAVAAEGWDSQRLRIVLHEFGVPDYEKAHDRRRFTLLARLIQSVRVDDLENLLHPATWWIEEQAERLPLSCEPDLLRTAAVLLPLAFRAGASRDGELIGRAINHPAGHLAEALLRRLWFRQPRKGSGLPDAIEPLLTKIMREDSPAGLLARVLLSQALPSLYFVDPQWTREWLLPKFRWDSDEAPDAWQSYLWQPRYDPDLVAAFKNDFLEFFDRWPEAESSRQRASQLLVFISIHIPESFSRREVAAILRRLPSENLAHAAGALTLVLKQSERPEQVWRNRIEPWLGKHWPVGGGSRTQQVAQKLAELAIEAGDAFPQAVAALRARIVCFEQDGDWIDHLISQSDLPEKSPDATLELLERMVPVELSKPWSWSSLGTLLDRILERDPGLGEDHRYRRLRDVAVAAGRL